MRVETIYINEKSGDMTSKMAIGFNFPFSYNTVVHGSLLYGI